MFSHDADGPPAMPLPLSFRDSVGRAMQGYAADLVPPLAETVDEPFAPPTMTVPDYVPVVDHVALQAPAVEINHGAVAFGLLLVLGGAVALGLAS